MSRYFVTLIIALAIAFGVTNGASLKIKNNVDPVIGPGNKYVEIYKHLTKLLQTYSYDCVEKSLSNCANIIPGKAIITCLDNYVEEHKNDICVPKNKYVSNDILSSEDDYYEFGMYLIRLMDNLPSDCFYNMISICRTASSVAELKACAKEYTEENVEECTDHTGDYTPFVKSSKLKDNTFTDIIKITAYLWKLSKNVPAACYIQVFFTCRTKPIYENFKACAVDYMAKNQEQCTNNGVIEFLNVPNEVSKGVNIKEIIKIAAYLYQLSKEVPAACYVKVVFTCKNKHVFNEFKLCAETYVAENKDQCSNNYQATEFLNVPAEKPNKININETIKIAVYLKELTEKLPGNCVVKVFFACEKNSYFNNFKICAENYIANHKEECTKKSQDTEILNLLTQEEDGSIVEAIKIAAYLAKLVQKVPIKCYIKVVVTCVKEKVYEFFKACSESYISENPEVCPIESFTEVGIIDDPLKEITKIVEYIYELSKSYPKGCIFAATLVCKTEIIFGNFEACTESFFKANPKQCAKISKVSAIEEINIDEVAKIVKYVFELSQKIPVTCSINFVGACLKEQIFENFKTCAESYIAANPEQCAKKSKVSEILNDFSNSEIALSTNFVEESDVSDYELFKIALYVRKLYRTIPTNCFVKLIFNCRKAKTYSSFKYCGDKYVEDNQATCTFSKNFF